jgi:hypothetical protein
MITNLFTSDELATEIENITLCFIRDDIGEYINITVKDLINNWDDQKWADFVNHDPCMGDVLIDDPDLSSIINDSNYCPCWGGLFDELDAINEYLLNGDGDLELLSAVYECCSDIKESIKTITDGDYSVYSDCKDDYDLGYYIIDEFYRDLTDKSGFIANYIDYEALGRDHRLESNGTFSELGWVEVY